MNNLSVLVVDDEVANCENMADILELEGHNVTWFDNPDRALEEIGNERTQFDLAILDLKMPNMDGIELLRNLRGLQPDLPAILATAYIYDEDISDEDRRLFELILSKPVDIESLVSSVQKKEFPLVICVDDDAEFCDNLTEIFASRRIHCECFHDFESARKCLQEKDFDVALLDVRLPDTDGLEAAKNLKEINPDITSFLVTGFPSDVPTKEDSISSLGINYVFEKPIRPDELIEAISRVRR